MLCGIVDLGSNTIRLSIYHCDQGQFRLLLHKKTMAGLAGYVREGILSDSGILVACRTLAAYRALLDNFNVTHMHVFATASLRNIFNTAEAVETIRDVTGIQVEVLSGEEDISTIGSNVRDIADAYLDGEIDGDAAKFKVAEYLQMYSE